VRLHDSNRLRLLNRVPQSQPYLILILNVAVDSDSP
jgi:hypothetical protein